jgi:hypothetical protein
VYVKTEPVSDSDPPPAADPVVTEYVGTDGITGGVNVKTEPVSDSDPLPDAELVVTEYVGTVGIVGLFLI